MRETGIVRRIDDLGRVVIPKEIRRTLRINHGDPLELFTDKDQIVFKKYSPVKSVNDLAEGVADSLFETINKPCIIVDTDTLVYISKGKVKEGLNKTNSSELDKIIKERKTVVLGTGEGKTIPLYKGDESGVKSQVITPIVANGDVYGALIVENKDADYFNEQTLTAVNLSALVLSKYFS